MERRITIVSMRRPVRGNVNDELQWLGESLGLFGSRDRDKSCFRIFISLLKASKHGQGLTSDELAEQLTLARGTVVHHVNNLMSTGIVIHERKKYMLREGELSALVQDIQRDTQKTLEDMKKFAEELDKLLGA